MDSKQSWASSNWAMSSTIATFFADMGTFVPMADARSDAWACRRAPRPRTARAHAPTRAAATTATTGRWPATILNDGVLGLPHIGGMPTRL